MAFENPILLYLPISIPFVLALWLMIFLQTYIHFPKMEKSKRIKESATNATILSAVLWLLTCAAFCFLVERLIR